MSQENYNLSKSELQKYNRLMLRSAFKSLFWSIFSAKNAEEGYKFQDLADALGKDKSLVSRWFTGEPNWTVDSIADIADALGVEIQLQAAHQKSGTIYSPTGVVEQRTLQSTDMQSPPKAYEIADMGLDYGLMSSWLSACDLPPRDVQPLLELPWKSSAMNTHNCRAISSGTALPSEAYIVFRRPAPRLKRSWEREISKSK